MSYYNYNSTGSTWQQQGQQQQQQQQQPQQQLQQQSQGQQQGQQQYAYGSYGNSSSGSGYYNSSYGNSATNQGGTSSSAAATSSTQQQYAGSGGGTGAGYASQGYQYNYAGAGVNSGTSGQAQAQGQYQSGTGYGYSSAGSGSSSHTGSSGSNTTQSSATMYSQLQQYSNTAQSSSTLPGTSSYTNTSYGNAYGSGGRSDNNTGNHSNSSSSGNNSNSRSSYSGSYGYSTGNSQGQVQYQGTSSTGGGGNNDAGRWGGVTSNSQNQHAQSSASRGNAVPYNYGSVAANTRDNRTGYGNAYGTGTGSSMGSHGVGSASSSSSSSSSAPSASSSRWGGRERQVGSRWGSNSPRNSQSASSSSSSSGSNTALLQGPGQQRYSTASQSSSLQQQQQHRQQHQQQGQGQQRYGSYSSAQYSSQTPSSQPSSASANKQTSYAAAARTGTPAAAAPAPALAPKAGTGAPGVGDPTLVAYVQRSLNSARSAVQKKAIEGLLKELLQQVMKSPEGIAAYDWTLSPIPVAYEPLPRLVRKGAGGGSYGMGSMHEDRRTRIRQRSRTPSPDRDAGDAGRKGKKGKKGRKGAQNQKGGAKKRKKGLAVDEYVDPAEQHARTGRADRFKNKSANSYNSAYSGDDLIALDWSSLEIVGTCQDLEKQYLRLTSAPSPATIRPESVLKRTLAMLIDKWIVGPDYAYTCEQFKSMRQDLTVQHIKNEFTVKVYETHARMAMEVGDLSEYNQCQTQLLELYETPLFRTHREEFLAYRILYYVVTNNLSAFAGMLLELDAGERELPAVKHALDLRRAVSDDNFVKFFRLYQTAPNQGALLLQKVLQDMRYKALVVVARSYKPTQVAMAFFTRMLAFDKPQEAKDFVVSCGGVLTDDQEMLKTADTTVHKPVLDSAEAEDVLKGITHAIV